MSIVEWLSNGLVFLCIAGDYFYISRDVCHVVIIEPRSNKRLTWDGLQNKLAEYPVILLGEEHDNDLHHKIQLSIIDFLHRSGGIERVVMEMIYPEQQIPIKRFVAEYTMSQGSFNQAHFPYLIKWRFETWPWHSYQKIVSTVLSNDISLVFGNLSRKEAESTRLGKQLGAYPAGKLTAIEKLVDDYHSDLIGSGVINKPSRAFIHASINNRLYTNAVNNLTGRSVVVAGNHHIRNDHGVRYLCEINGYDSCLSLGMVGFGNADIAPDSFDIAMITFNSIIGYLLYELVYTFR